MALDTLEATVKTRIDQWLSGNYDEETKKTIRELLNAGSYDELTDSFYKDLEFGTGGLRGIMGVGTNRMNKYTVGLATQGFANYLKKQGYNTIKVAISYDSRNNSKEFAQTVADIFSSNDIEVYLFSSLRPTPLLSYAVRKLHCQAGVMLTASHNPKEYNGYKAYWNDGGQLVPPHDEAVIHEVNQVSIEDLDFGGKQENIHLLKEELDDQYIEEALKLKLNAKAVEEASDLKIVYSPIHGTGITLVPKALKAWGFKDVLLVDEQAEPNGNFPTVVYPNPEEKEAMSMALNKGQALSADLVLATDPDADRVGVGCKNIAGEWQLLNGNQIGSLLVDYVLSSKHASGNLKDNDYVCKTIVTTELIAQIAKAYGVPVYDVLTGFKYIGQLITQREGKQEFLVGGEESYGFLVGEMVRDKDAVISCVFIAEMAAFYKTKGKTLFEALLELYVKYGFYKEKLISVTKKGKAGAEEIKAMMERLRLDMPRSLGGYEVAHVRDYANSIETDMESLESRTIDLPKSDVLQFITKDGSVISARPSGTEPKIKFYCSAKMPLKDIDSYDEVNGKLDDKIDAMMKDILS
ncbi:phospho-sugar mutase [Olivibacter sitiensis]|uniref:phospho-sugar mutase n=1 Tax=Olivibacter sitiensis TaxID=376470 RepID=UPI0003F902D0|nr:phospho-sugar mutase [Olivibacter sitiensis]